MPALTPLDREILSRIYEVGGKLHIITHSKRVADPKAIALLQWANRMCDIDCMRCERISGDKNAPRGERCYDFILTKKAERVVEKG